MSLYLPPAVQFHLVQMKRVNPNELFEEFMEGERVVSFASKNQKFFINTFIFFSEMRDKKQIIYLMQLIFLITIYISANMTFICVYRFCHYDE